MLAVEPSDLPIDRSEVLRYLGYKPGKRKIGGKIMRLLDEETNRARTLINPRGLYRIVDAGPFIVHKLFKDAQKIAFGVCTIGEKLEQEVKKMFKSGEGTRAVLLDAIGSVCAEAITNRVNDELINWAISNNLKITRRFSPGYGSWNVNEQSFVFECLGKFTAGVKLNPSGIMTPLKSVTFACKLGTAKMEEINKGDKCKSCNMRENCAFSQKGICHKTAIEA